MFQPPPFIATSGPHSLKYTQSHLNCTPNSKHKPVTLKYTHTLKLNVLAKSFYSKKMKPSTALGFIFALFICTTLVIATDDDLQTKCSAAFTKVTSCLSFVTAKANIPTKECCSAVTEIRKDNPACLCYFIQMANNGSVEQVKSLGIKVSQLLLLPSACKLANSNISECPSISGPCSSSLI